jgi:hypothetical protein
MIIIIFENLIENSYQQFMYWDRLKIFNFKRFRSNSLSIRLNTLLKPRFLKLFIGQIEN